MEKDLNEIVAGTAIKWKERAKRDRANRENISRSQASVLGLMDLNNIKQN